MIVIFKRIVSLPQHKGAVALFSTSGPALIPKTLATTISLKKIARGSVRPSFSLLSSQSQSHVQFNAGHCLANSSRAAFSTSSVLSDQKVEVDGIHLNYEQAGEGPETVLCLPGIIGCIQADYGKIFEKMDKKKFTICSWDPPGYGKSRPPDRDFTGEFYRRDAHLVVKLMEKMGHKKYSILGWSNGGITGAYLAADFPDKVNKLVTWGSHSYADDRAVLFSRMMGNLDMWSEKMKAPMLAMYGEEYLLKMLKDWGDSVEEFYKKGEDIGFKEGLPKIKCPALIIHGEEDPVLGVEHAEYLANNIKNATLYVMPKAKHNLHLRYTDEFLQLVEKFILS